MSEAPRARSSAVPLDPYSELLSRTRALRSEQRAARDAWFQALQVEGKEEVLFELEVLLKAAACFSTPRNHPGSPRRGPIVAQDYRQATVVFRDGLQRATSLARQLLGPRDRAFVFHRYLETVLPEDSARTRLLHEGTSQNTPEDSLIALRHALTTTNEVLEGLLRSPRVPFRTFYAVLTSVQREVGRSVFFNPLTALEFRPEFDRIKSTQVLDLLRAVPGEEAHRLVALTFLSLFRMLRYLRLLTRMAAETGRRRRIVGRGYLVLSVLRSDARALSEHLRQRAGPQLAASFERDLLRVHASELGERAAALRTSGRHLVEVRSALDGIAGNLRLELRRAFQYDLPSIDSQPTEHQFRVALQTIVRNLRPAFQNGILFLAKALGVSLEENAVFDDTAARRESSERLRRDVWMFARIVRAFSAKARHSPVEDRWTTVYTFQYVSEFLAYFRAMGYPLLRAANYPRFDAFMSAMNGLDDSDVIDSPRLERAIEECDAFHGFLLELFEDISKRDVLAGTPFDRRSAASALRLYLGD